MQKLHIVKIGGKVIDTPSLLEATLQDLADLPEKCVLVHGGGRRADTILSQLGLTPKMQEGRRVTDRSTLEVVTMVYAGLINKQLVANLQARGCQAIGISGADGNAVMAKMRPSIPLDYGFAGDITDKSINSDLFSKLLAQGLLPVVCPITHNGKNQLLNTNADTIAANLAIALSANFEVHLSYCFEHEGVLDNPLLADSVIPEINNAAYTELRQSKKIAMGMVPKLENAFMAVSKGVHQVYIKKAGSLRRNNGTKISGC